MKKNSTRQCLLTRKNNHKNDLIRFVIINNQGVLDLKNEIKARGYYLSYDINQELLKKKKTIIHKFSNKDKFLEELQELIKRNNNEKTSL